VSAVVFDLDGTLIDSAPDLHAAAVNMLADHGLGPIGIAQTRAFIGNGVPVLVARIMGAVGLAEDPGRHAAMVSDFLRHYAAEPAARTTVYPGVLPALEALRGAGHRLGICTNKPAGPARVIADALGLAPHFEALVGGDTLAVKKPDPAPLARTFADLGAARGIYVGDSETDADTARAAGVPFLLFTEGYRKSPVAEIAHDAAFERFTDLPPLIAHPAARAG